MRPDSAFLNSATPGGWVRGEGTGRGDGGRWRRNPLEGSATPGHTQRFLMSGRDGNVQVVNAYYLRFIFLRHTCVLVDLIGSVV